MTMVRALLLASLLGSLVLGACGSGGAGQTTANPALGTNKPAASPKQSGDPYSDYGY